MFDQFLKIFTYDIILALKWPIFTKNILLTYFDKIDHNDIFDQIYVYP